MASKKLVLHFDLNKTIVMCDLVQGVTLEKMFNALLSECCYGEHAEIPSVLNPEDLPALAATWYPIPPIEPSVELRPGLITFADFLEKVLQMPKKDRNELKGAFTHEGCVGEAFESHFKELMRLMRLPPGVFLPGTNPDIRDGNHFIVPSFFRFLRSLKGRDVALVFRTFGSEMKPVAEELNAFCRGVHPMYPNVHMDGTQGSIDYQLHLPHATARILRSSEGIHMAFVNTNGMVDMARGFQEVWDALHQLIESGIHTLGIRDDYFHWAENGESDTSGKLLLVDAFNPSAKYHHIIFDDNVELDRHHIVDVRDLHTGEPIPYEQAVDRWVVKVEPLLCIRDPDYFIEALRRCEENMRLCPICNKPQE